MKPTLPNTQQHYHNYSCNQSYFTPTTTRTLTPITYHFFTMPCDSCNCPHADTSNAKTLDLILKRITDLERATVEYVAATQNDLSAPAPSFHPHAAKYGQSNYFGIYFPLLEDTPEDHWETYRTTEKGRAHDHSITNLLCTPSWGVSQLRRTDKNTVGKLCIRVFTEDALAKLRENAQDVAKYLGLNNHLVPLRSDGHTALEWHETMPSTTIAIFGYHRPSRREEDVPLLLNLFEYQNKLGSVINLIFRYDHYVAEVVQSANLTSLIENGTAILDRQVVDIYPWHNTCELAWCRDCYAPDHFSGNNGCPGPVCGACGERDHTARTCVNMSTLDCPNCTKEGIWPRDHKAWDSCCRCRLTVAMRKKTRTNREQVVGPRLPAQYLDSIWNPVWDIFSGGSGRSSGERDGSDSGHRGRSSDGRGRGRGGGRGGHRGSRHSRNGRSRGNNNGDGNSDKGNGDGSGGNSNNNGQAVQRYSTNTTDTSPTSHVHTDSQPESSSTSDNGSHASSGVQHASASPASSHGCVDSDHPETSSAQVATDANTSTQADTHGSQAAANHQTPASGNNEQSSAPSVHAGGSSSGTYVRPNPRPNMPTVRLPLPALPLPENLKNAGLYVEPHGKAFHNKWYALAGARVPGIYATWATVEPLTHQYPGSRFRSFKTQDEAWSFLEQWRPILKGSLKILHQNPDWQSTIASPNASIQAISQDSPPTGSQVPLPESSSSSTVSDTVSINGNGKRPQVSDGSAAEERSSSSSNTGGSSDGSPKRRRTEGAEEPSMSLDTEQSSSSGLSDVDRFMNAQRQFQKESVARLKVEVREKGLIPTSDNKPELVAALAKDLMGQGHREPGAL